MTTGIRALVGSFAIAASAATAQVAPPTGSELGRLVACRAIAGSAERLACFDAQAAALDEAVRRRELTVVDAREIDRKRREGFGLASSDRTILSHLQGRPAPLPLKRDGVIRSVSAFSYGRYTLTLADGPVWRNVDLLDTPPAVGLAVHIDKTPFGAYLLKIPGYISVHAVRVR